MFGIVVNLLNQPHKSFIVGNSPDDRAEAVGKYRWLCGLLGTAYGDLPFDVEFHVIGEDGASHVDSIFTTKGGFQDPWHSI